MNEQEVHVLTNLENHAIDGGSCLVEPHAARWQLAHQEDLVPGHTTSVNGNTNVSMVVVQQCCVDVPTTQPDESQHACLCQLSFESIGSKPKQWHMDTVVALQLHRRPSRFGPPIAITKDEASRELPHKAGRAISMPARRLWEYRCICHAELLGAYHAQPRVHHAACASPLYPACASRMRVIIDVAADPGRQREEVFDHVEWR
mmetsp:Transcript_104090/g.290003  ORF Transcript_104090/g.290003 Transcript_104090/m.290003 type:complete len:203 (+) Transcript_104090:650-1258(+)